MGAPDWFVDVFPIKNGDILGSYVTENQRVGMMLIPLEVPVFSIVPNRWEDPTDSKIGDRAMAWKKVTAKLR